MRGWMPTGARAVLPAMVLFGCAVAGTGTERVWRDASGRDQRPFDVERGRAAVLVFIAVDCPVSNGYAPELSRLAGEYAARGVAFYFVHSDPDATAEVADRHAKEYGFTAPVLTDPAGTLARRVGATRTPEAAVVDPDGAVRYLGRIDDRYADVHKPRPEPRRRDLREAIEDVLAGRAVRVPRTEVVGCDIPAK